MTDFDMGKRGKQMGREEVRPGKGQSGEAGEAKSPMIVINLHIVSSETINKLT